MTRFGCGGYSAIPNGGVSPSGNGDTNGVAASRAPCSAFAAASKAGSFNTTTAPPAIAFAASTMP